MPEALEAREETSVQGLKLREKREARAAQDGRGQSDPKMVTLLIDVHPGMTIFRAICFQDRVSL